MIALAASVLAALVVGLVTDLASGLAVLGALLAGIVAYHLRHLYALRHWLDHGETPDPPRARGAWDRLHASLLRSRRAAARREAELEDSITRWRQAARALPDGVVLLDGNRIAWCNDVARAHLGIDAARDAGTPITHLVRIPAFIAYLESGDHTRPVQVEPPQGLGTVLSLQVVSYGDDQHLVLTRDVTQFRRMEQVRREFVANVSHELRTPLTVIAGFLETLRDEHDPQAARRYLDLMDEQSRRMLRLVEDLLTLSSLESSPPPAMDEAIAMEALIERVAADARALSAGRHAIEVRSEPGLDLVGSDQELTSAFGNLVSNAIRYTPEGGRVRLAWRATEDGAAFEVEDSGIGIAPEHIPRLTERFYRVDRGRSRETGGTGLGLAIVKHALGRHGATLEIASEPGRGSRFTARFAGARVRRAAAGQADRSAATRNAP